MKLIYTNENRYLVHNIENIVVNAGFEVMLKNEFTAGAAGDLVPHETWLELWVMSDSDYDKVITLLDESFSRAQDTDWHCRHCEESNNTSFHFCWQCQSPAPSRT